MAVIFSLASLLKFYFIYFVSNKNKNKKTCLQQGRMLEYFWAIFTAMGSPVPVKIDRVYRGWGGWVAMLCSLCSRARADSNTHTHTHTGARTQPYGSSHVLSFKGIHRSKWDAWYMCSELKGSWTLTVNGGFSGGGMPSRVFAATVSVYLFALWHSDAEQAQLLHWIICYVIWCHDKGSEMWSSKLVKCALCKF